MYVVMQNIKILPKAYMYCTIHKEMLLTRLLNGEP